MDLDRHIAELRARLATAVVGDAETVALAERIADSLDAAARLVLLDVLSEAAGEITREIAPGSVDVRLRGRDPELLVSMPAFPAPDAERRPTVGDESAEDATDGSTTRTTLRLPDRLKGQVESAAAAEGLSVNAWLVRAVTGALEQKPRRAGRGSGRSSGDSFTGWVR